MDSTKNDITVNCPCCGAQLTIDAALGKVLRHDPPPTKRSDLDLDNVQKMLQEQARRREEIFAQSSADLKIKSELLDKKFAAALEKSKDEPVTKPMRDIDWD
ncbi:MAG: hypothetical protein LBT74_02910 [Acidobacteriota bacterium]|jgi:hypothetical protein|nr:hypothetical protein [Acidobacteriota bacterium]